MKRGTIALDVDKTLTDSSHRMPDKVASYLTGVQKLGYDMIFVTGREFVYAMDALSKLNFPFFLGTQNGADLFRLPEKEHLKSVYFDQAVVDTVETLFDEIKGDFLLYSGYEKGDFCYFRPHKYSKQMQDYLKIMQARAAKPWKAVDHFKIKHQKSFPFIKAIGKKETFLDLEPKILKNHSVELVIIQDPRSDEYQYMLISDMRATKDQAVKYFMETFSLSKPLIAAGDDYNDRSMLEFADISIAMCNAPEIIKSKADIVAPSCEVCGIIEGLEEAFSRC